MVVGAQACFYKIRIAIKEYRELVYTNESNETQGKYQKFPNIQCLNMPVN